MILEIKKKIKKSKINLKPFPHIIIRDFLPKANLDKLNIVLPSYNEVDEKQIIFQSSSETKKTIMPNSKIFKSLLKKKYLRK